MSVGVVCILALIFGIDKTSGLFKTYFNDARAPLLSPARRKMFEVVLPQFFVVQSNEAHKVKDKFLRTLHGPMKEGSYLCVFSMF